jgi:hypothetical protein
LAASTTQRDTTTTGRHPTLPFLHRTPHFNARVLPRAVDHSFSVRITTPSFHSRTRVSRAPSEEGLPLFADPLNLHSGELHRQEISSLDLSVSSLLVVDRTALDETSALPRGLAQSRGRRTDRSFSSPLLPITHPYRAPIHSGLWLLSATLSLFTEEPEQRCHYSPAPPSSKEGLVL